MNPAPSNAVDLSVIAVDTWLAAMKHPNKDAIVDWYTINVLNLYNVWYEHGSQEIVDRYMEEVNVNEP